MESAIQLASYDARNEGISEGEMRVLSNPDEFSLVSRDEYDEMIKSLIDLSDNDSTPYTSGWFFIAERDWIYTNVDIFPYFFDSHTEGWMYFKSGFESPTFYLYAEQEWITFQ